MNLMMHLWPVPVYTVLAGVFWSEVDLRGYLPMGSLEIYGLAWMTGLGVFVSVEHVFTEWPNVKHRWQQAQSEPPEQDVRLQEGKQ